MTVFRGGKTGREEEEQKALVGVALRPVVGEKLFDQLGDKLEETRRSILTEDLSRDARHIMYKVSSASCTVCYLH